MMGYEERMNIRRGIVEHEKHNWVAYAKRGVGVEAAAIERA